MASAASVLFASAGRSAARRGAAEMMRRPGPALPAASSSATRWTSTYYTPAHEYCRWRGGVATVGVTDFAQAALGDIVFVDLGGSTSGSGPGTYSSHHSAQSNSGSDNNDRERSLTLGSEFDLSWALGKDGRGMSISGLLTPLGEPAAGDGMSGSNEGGTAVSSTAQHAGAAESGAGAFAATFLPRVPENSTGPGQKIPGVRARGDSTASSQQFLNGLMSQQPQGQAKLISHTPPTQMGTSYENSHFGKRMRAGSISGRLRSASDLEDTGIISRDQKAILKDLIIAGDSNVQGAIDKYEAGDPSALEEMIKSGAFARSSDVDLLGDLDLDFLNVHGGDDDMMFGNMDDIGIEPTRVVGTANPASARRPRGDSVDDINVHRMRANSLALPGMLLDGANPDEVASVSFGQWTDKDVAGGSQPQDAQTQGAHRQLAPNVADRRRYSSECDVLMASKGQPPPEASEAAAKISAGPPQDKKPKAKKEKTRKPYTKKEKKEPRERKSQSKMKDMMEGMSSDKKPAAQQQEEEESKEVQSGLGRPRSMSDPNLSVRLDDHGLLRVDGPEGWVGAYSPDSRQMRIERFMEKRNHRVWVKKVKYDVRKNFADSRLRVKGRFVKKEDEMLMRELMSLT